MTTKLSSVKEDEEHGLLTPVSLAQSLSAPRAPPHGSALRDLLAGKDVLSRRSPSNYHDDDDDERDRDSFLLARLRRAQRKSRARSRPRSAHRRGDERRDKKDDDDDDDDSLVLVLDQPPAPHPHLLLGGGGGGSSSEPCLEDRVTRFLGANLSLSSQRRFRDSGGFRTVSDTSVLGSVPFLVVTEPRTALAFARLSRATTTIRYGPHPSQTTHLYEPDQRQQQPQKRRRRRRRGLVFFVVSRSKRARFCLFGSLFVLRSLSTTTTTTNISPLSTYVSTTDHSSSFLSTDERTIHLFIHPRLHFVVVVVSSLFTKHGGAWGSGRPWMYRLVALPFLRIGVAVAIVGYRVYPDAEVTGQVDDLEAALREIRRRRPDLLTKPPPAPGNKGAQFDDDDDNDDDWLGVSLVGHSSGAHVALLLLVSSVERALKHKHNHNHVDDEKGNDDDDSPPLPLASTLFDSFVGLSGPYHVPHHYDYEAARGVEEISPMKAACGHAPESLLENSPAVRLARVLAEHGDDDDARAATILRSSLPPALLLVHGVEDGTVPFTNTAETARALRSCGVDGVDELYLGKTTHVDTVLHLMRDEGRTRDGVLEWLSLGARTRTRSSRTSFSSRSGL